MVNFQHRSTIILLFFLLAWIISLLSVSRVDGGNAPGKLVKKITKKHKPPAQPSASDAYVPEPPKSPEIFRHQSAEENSKEIVESSPKLVADVKPNDISSSNSAESVIIEQMVDLLSEPSSIVTSPKQLLSELQNDEMLLLTSSKQSEEEDFQYAPECNSGIYCFGHLLVKVSFAQVYSSQSSTNEFVNLRMFFDEATISKRFEGLLKKQPDPSDDTLRQFIRTNFARDLAKKCDLIDYTNRLPLADRISDARYKHFAISVHNIWKNLAKKIDNDAKENPDRHSFIYVPNCIIGNFVTSKPFVSYLHNYWITEGLIRSHMLQTYKGILENIFYIIEKHGQMLTGNNIYFKGRSHLPMLIKMTKNYQNVAPDGEVFVKRNISALTTEFEWWYKYRMVEFEKDGKKYKMARYYHQKRAIPRPEAFYNDYHFANINHGTIRLDKQQRTDFYRAVRATTESGYVFSSRFLRDGKNVSNLVSFLNLDTHNIIPTDLNSILEFNARQLGQWYRNLDEIKMAERYENISANLRNAIHEVLRNDNRGIWFDYNLESKQNNNEFVASNFTPLFTNSFDSTFLNHYGQRAVDYLIEEEIIRPDGTPRYYCVPVTKQYTGKKWDFPNCFPQAMSIIIEGLRNTGHELALNVAKNLAAMWIKTNYEGFSKYNRMFGKYNALKLGDELLFRDERKAVNTPIGYASTNGFLLTLFDYYGKEVDADDYRYDFESPPIFGHLSGMPVENFRFSGE